MAWARLDQDILVSPFFRSLSEAEKGVFCVMIAFASSRRGRIKFFDGRTDLLAEDLRVTEVTVTSVINKGTSFRLKNTDSPPLIIEDDELVFTGWDKFHPDPTNSERQKKYKDKQKVTDETVTPVNNATKRNETKRYEDNTHSLDSLSSESNSITAMSNAARARNENVDNSKSDNACPLPVETDLQRINSVDTEEFLERVGEYVALDENSRTGIIADIAKAKPSNEALFPILDQLAMAAADGRLGVSPVVENGRVITRGISNPVGWIRTQIKKTRASP